MAYPKETLQTMVDTLRRPPFKISPKLIVSILAHCQIETPHLKPDGTVNQSFAEHNYTNMEYRGQRGAIPSSHIHLKDGVPFCHFATDFDFFVVYTGSLANRYAIISTDDPSVFLQKLITGGWIAKTEDSVTLYSENFKKVYSSTLKMFKNGHLSLPD